MLSKFFARFQFVPFWRLTYWGFTPITNHLFHGVGWNFYGKSCDEFHNATTYLIVPLLGMLTVFHGDNDVLHVMSWNGVEPGDGVFDPLTCRFCAEEWQEVYEEMFD